MHKDAAHEQGKHSAKYMNLMYLSLLYAKDKEELIAETEKLIHLAYPYLQYLEMLIRLAEIDSTIE